MTADGGFHRRFDRSSTSSLVTRVLACGLLLRCIWALWDGPIHTPRHLILTVVTIYCLAWLVPLVAWPSWHVKIVERFVLVSFSLGFTWLLLEAAGSMGIVDYRKWVTFSTAIRERRENQYDPDMRFVRIPHVRLTGESRGNIALERCLVDRPPYHYDIRYDATGFRNERDLTSADIVFVGDSYIEGALVPTPEIATSVLARLTGLDVANIALAGYGPGEQLAALQKVGRPLNPKLVVWAFFEGNDPTDMWLYDDWVEAGRRSQYDWRPSLARTLADKLLRGKCQPDRELLRYYSGTFHGKDGSVTPVYFIGRPSTDVSESTLREIESVMSQAFALTREIGAELLVLFVPWKWRVYESAIELPEESRLTRWHTGDFPLRFERMLERISPEIGFIDLTIPLAREAESGTMVYLADDSHWSSEGHHAVASAVAQSLGSQQDRVGARSGSGRSSPPENRGSASKPIR